MTASPLKEARPDESVDPIAEPREPGPEATVALTLTFDLLTRLPPESSSCTFGCVVSGVPKTPSPGATPGDASDRRVGAPVVTAMLVKADEIPPPAEKEIPYDDPLTPLRPMPTKRATPPTVDTFIAVPSFAPTITPPTPAVIDATMS